MSVLQIIRDIEMVGGKIYLLDGGLKLAGKPGVVTPGLLAEVKNKKAEIINILSLEKNGTHSLRTLSPVHIVDNPKLDSPTQSQKLGDRISPIALAWLAENRVQLRKVGWSMRELYRRNISPGIAWSPMWNKDFLKVTLLHSRVIEFEFIDGGKDCTNKAYPIPQRLTQRKEK